MEPGVGFHRQQLRGLQQPLAPRFVLRSRARRQVPAELSALLRGASGPLSEHAAGLSRVLVGFDEVLDGDVCVRPRADVS